MVKCQKVSVDAINRIKQQPTEWEEIILYYISGMRLISRIYRESLKLHTQKRAHFKNRQRT